FSIFVSHRGPDAKQVLAGALVETDGSKDIFLDCLRLPRRVVNRNFVFGSLVRSKRILIVDTPNYLESQWCRKELCVAKIMSRLGWARLDRLSLPESVKELVKLKNNSLGDERYKEAEAYEMSPRILRDIEYWGRAPNKYSSRELGLKIDYFDEFEELFHHLN